MFNKPDLANLIHQSKSQHTIKDKSTGQVLGYAVMITDQAVSAEQVQLVPWLEGVQHPPVDGGVQLADGGPPDDVQGILESDLDLSQDSSINETLEEDLSSQANGEMELQENLFQSSQPRPKDNDYHASSDAVLDKSQTSFPSPVSTSPVSTSPVSTSPVSTSPPPVALPVHQPSRLVLSAIPVAPAVTSESTAGTLNPISSPSASNSTKPVVPTEMKTLAQSLACDIAAELRGNIPQHSRSGSAQQSSEMKGKRSLEENVDNTNKKKVTQKLAGNVEDNRVVLPGMQGRYDAFFEHVYEEGVDKRHRRVKCLLCGDGRLLSLENFHRHIKRIHEPPVKCDTCRREFSGEQIKVHKRKNKCVWQHLDFVEK
eukprot:GFUD01125786.1.p1 GENE.GFUD01125786.1~~GFUD01125786.1.p1  ORF type:complete len:371 (-),score=83.31 GFUD01125786.1:16-1128(-)